MKAVMIAAALAVAGCASTGEWVRADGAQVGRNTAALDQTACEGESTKAAMAADGPKFRVTPGGVRTASAVVFDGCMAEKGWLRR